LPVRGCGGRIEAGLSRRNLGNGLDSRLPIIWGYWLKGFVTH